MSRGASLPHQLLDRAFDMMRRDMLTLAKELQEDEVNDKSRQALDRYTRTLLLSTRQLLVEEETARKDLANLSDADLKDMLRGIEKGDTYEQE